MRDMGVLWGGMAALLALGALPSCGPDETLEQGLAVGVVERGTLSVTVMEGGTVQSDRPVKIRSTVEGRNAILEIVPEGTLVKPDDVVVVLDSSLLRTRRDQQKVELEQARSDLEQAEKALAIQAMMNQEEERAAVSRRDLAQQACKAYEQGTAGQEESKLRSSLMLAQERALRAQGRAASSRRLLEKDYISREEAEADELAAKQAREDVRLSEGDLEQFLKWTLPSETSRLQTELSVAEVALSRVQAQCTNETKRLEDVRNSYSRGFELKASALEKTENQIVGATIRAPSDGIIVYANKDWDESPIGKGREVREREEICIIPDLSAMVVEVNVHETEVKQVAPGQGVWIRIDALPNRKFRGTVSKVGVVPSTEGSYWNSDVKVYKTVVRCDEFIEGLRPGMHAEVEILVAELSDVVQVPIGAVVQVGAQSFVQVVDGGGSVSWREVELGMHNVAHVEVKRGLREGEHVCLAPQPGDLPRGTPAEPTAPASDPNPGATKPPATRAPSGSQGDGLGLLPPEDGAGEGRKLDGHDVGGDAQRAAEPRQREDLGGSAIRI